MNLVCQRMILEERWREVASGLHPMTVYEMVWDFEFDLDVMYVLRGI